jgi:pimeloyl-ACP methyl ester carboxylesterase
MATAQASRHGRPRKVTIGGSAQWILERSMDHDSPILLFVHGGPGTSQLTANRRRTKSLEQVFTVVDWDQRGAGKSYAAIRAVDRMTIAQFVADTLELSRRLLDEHERQRLVLVGHSWGSVVGALAVAAAPDLFAAYVGVGQVSNMLEGERLSYQWTLGRAREAGDRRAVRALEAMGCPPYAGDWQRHTVRQRRYLARYGGEMYRRRTGAMATVLGNLAFSSEYSLKDRANYFRGILGSMRLLWPELMTVNLFTQVPRVDVPVFLFEGRHDWEVPSILAATYFDELDAPSKQLVWFEQSAHLPNAEETDRYNEHLRRTVRPIALDFGA